MKAGCLVEVVPPERPDPWVTPKAGWQGVVVALAEDVGPEFVRVRFVAPYCPLNVPRVMPVACLRPVRAVRAGAQLKMVM